jgi:AraC-like DNA-binding protein/quercetin dioxygenase-like cupin family protein
MPSPAPASSRTSGRVLRAHQWDGLSLEEVVMPRALVVPEHCHDGAQLYFLLDGTYMETLGDREHVLRPGSSWFRNPRVRHRNAVVGDDPALVLIVTAEPRRLEFLARRRRANGPVRSLLVDATRAELLGELRRQDEVSHVALEAWALLLLSHVERAALGVEPGPAGWLEDALGFIERAYAEPLSTASVAAAVAVRPGTLATAFRRRLGTSVGERIRAVRLRHARQALVATRIPIQQIATDCGFFDQAHLGRWCKRAFGLSPAELRRTTSVGDGRAVEMPARDPEDD